MSELTDQPTESNTPRALKDKRCPYCGQEFTSSSLGRHLDLYVRNHNPKKPDGVHDVDAIKKSRGIITRRVPRGSLGKMKDLASLDLISKSRSGSNSGESTQVDHTFGSPVPLSETGLLTADPSHDGHYPLTTPSLPDTNAPGDEASKFGWAGLQNGKKGRSGQRTASKQFIQKSQHELRQQLANAVTTARATELALRELLGTWRIARQQVDNNSMPFDFDPLSLDFPALTLECLQPPPTLYSSTQHPTSTSWSVQVPTKREFVALQSYFSEEFRHWKLACKSATTAAIEEVNYSLGRSSYYDRREAAKRADKSADNLEKQVFEHLESSYTVWESLNMQRRQELWVLELARSVGRKHKEGERRKAEEHRLKLENANLLHQIDQLRSSQQPKEFNIRTPSIVHFDKELLKQVNTLVGSAHGDSVLDLGDRQTDLSEVVRQATNKWKKITSSGRDGLEGMAGQRSLMDSSQARAGEDGNGRSFAVTTNGGGRKDQVQTPKPIHPHQALRRTSTVGTIQSVDEPCTSSADLDGIPGSVEASDQDADADMEDDDAFGLAIGSPIKLPTGLQQSDLLSVPKSRAIQQMQPQSLQHLQQQPSQTVLQRQDLQQARVNPDQHFLMVNGAAGSRTPHAISMSKSMPNINMGMPASPMNTAGIGMAMQGVRQDMYME